MKDAVKLRRIEHIFIAASFCYTGVHVLHINLGKPEQILKKISTNGVEFKSIASRVSVIVLFCFCLFGLRLMIVFFIFPQIEVSNEDITIALRAIYKG